MSLNTSPIYKALVKSNNLMWGGDKFLMKMLLILSLILIFGVRGYFGYIFGGAMLFLGRIALVGLAKWDEEALPILFQNFMLRKFYLSRGIYPGPHTNIIFTFNAKTLRVESGVSWYWRVYYFVFPASAKKPDKLSYILTKDKANV